MDLELAQTKRHKLQVLGEGTSFPCSAQQIRDPHACKALFLTLEVYIPSVFVEPTF